MVQFDYVVMRADATDLRDYEQRELAERIAPIIDSVRRRGDEAIPSGAGRDLRISAEEIERCVRALPRGAAEDLRLAQDRARRIAEAQRAAIGDFENEALPGIRCGLRHVPVQSAGTCVAPDEGLHDFGSGVIAARAAGVSRVVACVPARGDRIPALAVAVLALAGVREMYLAGGVRALAALTFGTESIPRVEVVFGAWDAATVEARRQLLAMSPGRLRSGTLVIADDSADPELIAADLICADGRAVLITTSPALAARASGEVERQLDMLPGHEEVSSAWRRHGSIRLVGDRGTACALADRYGLESVEVMAEDPRWYLARLHRCRQVFLGEAAGVALADGIAAEPPSSFLRAIAYREGHARDGDSFARLRRLAGLEPRARACEARRLVRPAALAVTAWN